MNFVSKLDHYLAMELRFVSQSRYPEAHETHKNFNYYPIGVLGDVEIHFMHYDNEDDALEKWERRKKRINKDNMIFAFTDRDLCTPELMQQFDDLPGRKILLTAHVCPWLESAVHIPAYRGQSEMGDGYTNFDTMTHIDYRRLIDGSALSDASEARPVSSLSSPV